MLSAKFTCRVNGLDGSNSISKTGRLYARHMATHWLYRRPLFNEPIKSDILFLSTQMSDVKI